MLAKIAVADYMTKHVVTVTPNTGITEAIKKMLDHKITSVPVVDGQGRLVGVFSEKDGVKLVVESAYNQSADGKVSDMMTREPPIIDAKLSLVDAALKFQEMATRSFPVFEDGELVGIISRVDVMRALITHR